MTAPPDLFPSETHFYASTTNTSTNRSALDAEPITETSNAQTDAQRALDAWLAVLDLTDVGNAERLAARHGHDLCFSAWP